MDYEKKYNEALERARKLYEQGTITESLCYVFSELIESEDERVRKELLSFFTERAKYTEDSTFNGLSSKEIISWLEKQDEHAKFRDSIQVGDNVTRNENGVLVNLSQLKRVAKKDEKQGEQKPTNIVEPKFKVGDWITNGATKPVQISSIEDDMYYTHNGTIGGDIESMDKDYHLWTIADAKDGDILIDKSNNRECPFIFKETKPSDIKTDILNPLTILGYCGIGGAGFTKGSEWGDTANCTYYPANKEQQNLLFQKIKEAGYEWDAEKKELNKVEQKDVIHKELTEFEKAVKQVMEEAIECGDIHNLKADADMLLSLIQKPAEEYNITGIRSRPSKGKLAEMIKNLKSVNEMKVEPKFKDGDVLNSPSHHLIWIYRDNEHYYACLNMNYVTKNVAIGGLIKIPSDARPATKDERTILFRKLKKFGYEWDKEKKQLKTKVIHKKLTEFEKAVKQVMEKAIGCGDTRSLKADAEMLLSLVHKSAWSEDDEKGLSDALWCCKQAASIAKDENDMGNAWYAEHWLKTLKERYTC